ncbi:LuxR C-terminal-related transcriptional regulator [Cnuibacter physcomitrellae]|uniref:LuxR C-terminal-related transcriptional regulator n=1 Tax=Cnuibacter physcomitrellae TaxID=1619308 RepID=UPI0012F48560|nr:LuxR C-terminal-related transcriptional regulator [Cnuibacter physcomitrellae]
MTSWVTPTLIEEDGEVVVAMWGVPRISTTTVDRPRIRARLDGPEALVTVIGPAGYGKTVAVAQWAAEADAVGVWARVRDRDVDSAAFVQDLADELLASGTVSAASPLRHLGEAVMAGADPWEVLCRALRDAGDLVIVVDDVDRLTDSAVDGLIRLAEDLPRLRVRATARRRTRLTEPGLGLVLDTAVVTTDELALTDDEARAILGPGADRSTVERILEWGGSPLIARALASGSTTAEGRQQAADHAFSSLLDDRIRAEDWDPELVDFLARTSVADALTLELATALSPRTDAERMLARAEEEGLGLWTGSPSRGEQFRYSPPAREAFAQLLLERQRSAVRPLNLIAAGWEATHGQPFSALERAVRFSDWALATSVVRESWHVLLRNHGLQVRDLFTTVPLLTLRRLPLIAMILALIYNARRSHRLRALELFALANYGASRQSSTAQPADRALLAGVQTAALRVSGRIRPALAAAERTYDTLVSMSDEDRDRLGPNEPTLYNQAGTTFFYGGRSESALDSFARSTAVGDAKGLTAGMIGLAMTAGVHAVSGDMPEAASTVAEADIRDWPEGWLTGYSGSFYRVARAFLALESFDAAEADRHLRTLDPHRETIEHWPLLTHLDTLVLLLGGRPEEALLRLESTIRTQRRRQGSSPFTSERLQHTVALAHLAAGDAVAAERALAGTSEDARLAVSHARISLARGMPDDVLRRLQDGGSTSGSSRSRGEALALTAAALAVVGDDRAALTAGRATLAFLGERGLGLPLALVPRSALEALEKSLRRSGSPELAEALGPAKEHAVVAGGLTSIRLTPRELEVARRLPTHPTLGAIADDLSVSPNTVKTQLRSLYKKLDVTSRPEALARLAVLGVTAGQGRSDPPTHDRG